MLLPRPRPYQPAVPECDSYHYIVSLSLSLYSVLQATTSCLEEGDGASEERERADADADRAAGRGGLDLRWGVSRRTYGCQPGDNGRLTEAEGECEADSEPETTAEAPPEPEAPAGATVPEGTAAGVTAEVAPPAEGRGATLPLAPAAPAEPDAVLEALGVLDVLDLGVLDALPLCVSVTDALALTLPEASAETEVEEEASCARTGAMAAAGGV